jgi:hypothetical protein
MDNAEGMDLPPVMSDPTSIIRTTKKGRLDV